MFKCFFIAKFAGKRCVTGGCRSGENLNGVESDFLAKRIYFLIFFHRFPQEQNNKGNETKLRKTVV